MNVQLRELGMLRVAAVSPELRVGDIAFNLKSIVAAVDHSKTRGARLVVFPELALTGYTCGDLFYQTVLLEKSREALFALAEETANSGVAIVLGAPVSCSGRLFNAAVVVNDGRICGIVPKTYLPNTQEFYEERWFSNAHDLFAQHLDWNGEKIAAGPDLLFNVEGFEDCVLGVEVCEDAWVAMPPSGSMAVAGATLLLNLSASPELLGKCSYRKALVESQSARCLAAYVYASAGPGESSTDLVFAGHSLVAEYGQTLAETERFQFATQVALADIDIQRLAQERMRNNSFAQSRPEKSYRMVPLQISDTCTQNLMRPVVRTPFVPPEAGERNARCQEIFSIQTTGLMKRLNHTDTQKAVVGISGGLDSTLALLVTIKAFDRLGWPRSEIKAVTMPGFGTTGRTRQNAVALAEQLGVSLTTINIGDAVHQHFLDIGQDPEHHDVTYENAQARERTQILMDLANRVGGLVVGTGDLSELALGWSTYNGDHMSMYGVNASVPKTLVRYLIEWCAEQEFSGVTSETLHDICATPVSPELIPPGENDEIRQKTEEEVGPYELHDFFLFQVVRCQSPPRKVAWLASHAFEHKYTNDEILKWLKVFYHRFFAQQFKRSCLPDGPKVGTVALSPRGDWRMPSDARVDLWLAELDSLSAESEAQ